jgi:hypothetical protein
MFSSILNFLRAHLVWSDYVLIVLLAIAVRVFCQGAPPPPVDTSQLHFLTLVDSLSRPGNNPSSHNSALLSVFQQRSATAASLRASREAGTMQARVIFCSILAGLASLLSRFKPKEINWQIQSVFLVLIAIMFFLDVQLEDTRNIQVAYDSVTDNEILLLANMKPNDTRWYIISFDAVHDSFEQVYRSPDRWFRKARLACQPNPERLAYCLVPWILAYLFARPTFRRKTQIRLRGT